MVLIDLQFEIGEGQYLSPAPSPLLFGKKDWLPLADSACQSRSRQYTLLSYYRDAAILYFFGKKGSMLTE